LGLGKVSDQPTEETDALSIDTVARARLACRADIRRGYFAAVIILLRRIVEYHLHTVFTNLGISSRNELERALPPEPTAAPASYRDRFIKSSRWIPTDRCGLPFSHSWLLLETASPALLVA